MEDKVKTNQDAVTDSQLSIHSEKATKSMYSKNSTTTVNKQFSWTSNPAPTRKTSPYPAGINQNIRAKKRKQAHLKGPWRASSTISGTFLKKKTPVFALHALHLCIENHYFLVYDIFTGLIISPHKTLSLLGSIVKLTMLSGRMNLFPKVPTDSVGSCI